MNLNAPIFNVLPVTSVYVTTNKTPYEFMQANTAGTMGLFHMTSGTWKTVDTLANANNDVFIGVIALDKNGNKVQEGNTSQMLYSPDEIIAYVSQFFTLRVGDLIYTGTPKGVGKVEENDILEAFLEGEKVMDLRIC